MITQAELKTVLHYDPETGIFTWRLTRGYMISGTQAGGISDRLTYKGKRYKIKRLAWLYMTGTYPNQLPISIDGNDHNFKWLNLTIETPKTVNKNHVDIGYVINDDSFGVFIIDKGKTTDLGLYSDIDSALETVKTYLCLK